MLALKNKVELLWRASGLGGTRSAVLHRKRMASQNHDLVLKWLCGRLKGAGSIPDDLTLICVSTYAQPTILEKSLRYIGIPEDQYVVLRPKVADGQWRGVIKIEALYDYIVKQKACKTKYVLHLDSADVVVTNHLHMPVETLREQGAKILFGTTYAEAGYECMPDIREWAVEKAREAGVRHKKIFLNSGVYISEIEILSQLLEDARRYITDSDLTRKQYRELRDTGRLCEHLGDFPRGIGSDQVIVRHLQPRYYPDLRLDYDERLSER